MKASLDAGEAAHLVFATSASPDAVGRDVVVAVGPNALLCF